MFSEGSAGQNDIFWASDNFVCRLFMKNVQVKDSACFYEITYK